MKHALAPAIVAALGVLMSCRDPLQGARGFQCVVDTDCDSTTWCIEGSCTERVDAGAKPSQYNTGVPRNVALSASGALSITQDGGVVDGLDIQGCVVVLANGVTIRRSHIRCGGYYVLEVAGTNTLIEDVEIEGTTASDVGYAVIGADLTVRRANIHGLSRGAYIGSNVLIDSCYVHDLVGTGAMGVGSDAANQLTVQNSNIDLAGLDGWAVMVDGAQGPLTNVLVEANWLNGGSWTVRAGDPNGSNIQINDNRFGRGATTGPLYLAPNATQARNVYDDNNAPVPVSP
jgi:hypothetical protein